MSYRCVHYHFWEMQLHMAAVRSLKVPSAEEAELQLLRSGQNMFCISCKQNIR